MAEPTCPYHLEHETRMKNLEVDMKEVKAKQTNPAVWVAVFGVLGTCVSTLGAFCGVIAVAWFRANGLIP